MKKLMIMLLSIFVISGCNGGAADISIQLKEEPTYTQGNASNVSFEITDGEEAVEGLHVTALFEMVKMDHGTVEVSLVEEEAGEYRGNVELPMAGEWRAIVNATGDGADTENTIEFTVGEGTKIGTADLAKEVLATTNGDEIVQEDLAFYEFINKLQIEMYREKDKQNYEGEELEEAMTYWDAQIKASQHPNTLITQIIRLRAVALLAEEKGHTATAEEIQTEIDEVKKAYAQSPVATEMIKQYGVEKFWDTQAKQYELIVLSSKVQQDVMDNVKKDNPDAQSQELQMLAQKKYEELLVSQVGTLDIKFNSQS